MSHTDHPMLQTSQRGHCLAGCVQICTNTTWLMHTPSQIMRTPNQHVLFSGILLILPLTICHFGNHRSSMWNFPIDGLWTSLLVHIVCEDMPFGSRWLTLYTQHNLMQLTGISHNLEDVSLKYSDPCKNMHNALRKKPGMEEYMPWSMSYCTLKSVQRTMLSMRGLQIIVRCVMAIMYTWPRELYLTCT